MITIESKVHLGQGLRTLKELRDGKATSSTRMDVLHVCRICWR